MTQAATVRARHQADVPVYARVVTALAACGQPPLAAGTRPRSLGSGAWHDAYRVRIADGYQDRYCALSTAAVVNDFHAELRCWPLDEAINCLDRLAHPLDEEGRLRTGSHAAIERRLRGYLTRACAVHYRIIHGWQGHCDRLSATIAA